MRKCRVELKAEDRGLLDECRNMTREQMWHELDKRRFEELGKKGVNVQIDMLKKSRCPKCTLMPPCKHYESTDEIVKDAFTLLTDASVKSVLP